jgi:hypothetical protein
MSGNEAGLEPQGKAVLLAVAVLYVLYSLKHTLSATPVMDSSSTTRSNKKGVQTPVYNRDETATHASFARGHSDDGQPDLPATPALHLQGPNLVSHLDRCQLSGDFHAELNGDMCKCMLQYDCNDPGDTFFLDFSGLFLNFGYLTCSLPMARW